MIYKTAATYRGLSQLEANAPVWLVRSLGIMLDACLVITIAVTIAGVVRAVWFF